MSHTYIAAGTDVFVVRTTRIMILYIRGYNAECVVRGQTTAIVSLVPSYRRAFQISDETGNPSIEQDHYYYRLIKPIIFFIHI